MQASRILRARTPLIQFKGKRFTPERIDHTPKAHPASPTHALPNSFKQYRETFASSHGPLASRSSFSAREAPKGVAFDRNELPARFRRMPFSIAEMECVESGGASLVN